MTISELMLDTFEFQEYLRSKGGTYEEETQEMQDVEAYKAAKEAVRIALQGDEC